MNRVLCIYPQPTHRPPNPPPNSAAGANADAAIQRLRRWASVCEHFSPLVGFDDQPEPDSLLLDVAGTRDHFGGETALLGTVAARLATAGCTARLALADTVGAAWAWAHYGPADQATVLVPSATTARGAELWRTLPMAALRLPSQVQSWLHELGLRQIGQLAELPRPALASRFGRQLLDRWDQLTGRLPELIVPHAPRPLYVASRTFEQPITSVERLRAECEPLLSRLVEQTSARQQGITQLHGWLRDESGHEQTLEVRLYRPTARVGYLLEMLDLQFERFAGLRPTESLRLTVLATDRLACRQQALFADLDETSVQQARQWGALVDRLASRLGYDAVLRPRLQPDHQPEFAYRYEPWVIDRGFRGARQRSARKTSAPKTPAQKTATPPTIAQSSLPHNLATRGDRDIRPLLLLRQPLALQVVSIVPEGPPLAFRHQGQEHRIARHWGPERIETGWWRGRGIGRDYYRVETTTGLRCWLFRRLADGRWFLHGWFD